MFDAARARWVRGLVAGAAIALVLQPVPDEARAEIPPDLMDQVITREGPAGTEYAFRAGTFNVSATDGTLEEGVLVEWTPAADLDVYFEITRDGELITQASSQHASYLDVDTVPEASHEYRVFMVDVSTDLSIEMGQDSGRKGFFAPVGLQAADFTDLDGVPLSWVDISNIESGYHVFRDGELIATVDPDVTVYEDLTATPLTSYTYCVQAYTTSGATSALARTESVPGITDLTYSHNGLLAATPDGFYFLDPALDGSGSEGPYGDEGLDGVHTGSTFFYTTDRTTGKVTAWFDKGVPVEFYSFTVSNPIDLVQRFGDELLFISRGTEGIEVYDAPSASIGSVDTPGEASGVALSDDGQTLFVADGSAVLSVDVSDPSSPVIVGSVAVPGWATELVVVEDYLIVACGSAGLRTVDVSDPAAPFMAGSYELGGDDAVGIVRIDAEVAVTRSSGGVLVLDATAPAFLRPVADVSGVAGGTGITADGNWIYVATNAGSVEYYEYVEPITTDVSCDTGGQGTIVMPTDLAATYGHHLDRTVLTWSDNASLETGYRVIRDGLSVDLPADTESYEDIDAAVLGVEQTYALYALDPDGVPVYAGSVTGIFGPETMIGPSNVQASESVDSDESITVTWDDAPAEDYYTIYRGIGAGSEVEYDTASADAISYEDENAEAGVEYSYCVVASAEAGGTSPVGAECDLGSRADILPPVSVTATDGDYETFVDISWVPDTDQAVLYKIRRDGVGIQTVAPSVTTAQDYEAIPGVEHTYTVEAVNALGVAVGTSDAGSRVLIAPSGLSAEAVSETRILVAWNDESAAESGYRVIRFDGGVGDPDTLAIRGQDARSFFDETAAPGVEHTYRVEAFDALGTSEYVEATGGRELEPPVSFEASDAGSESEVFLTWDDESGAESGFRIYRDDVGLLDTVGPNVTAYTDDTPLVGVTYTYEIEVFDEYGDGARVSDTGLAEMLPPGSLQASDYYDDGEIWLTWVDQSELNTDYIIYRNGEQIATTGGTTYKDDDDVLMVGVAYEYCVVSRATGGGVSEPACDMGSFQEEAELFGNLGWITDLTASDGDFADNVRLEWTVNDPFDRIDLYRDGLVIESLAPTAESYNDFDAVPGVNHTYDLVAIQGTTTSSPNANVGWIPPDGAITGRVATRSGAAVEGVDVCVTPSPNQALQFDGVSSMEFAINRPMPAGDFTIELWMRTTHNAGTLFHYGAAGPPGGHRDEIRIWDTNNLSVTINGTEHVVGTDLSDYEWHHLAMTRDGDTGAVQMYVDGVLQTWSSSGSTSQVFTDDAIAQLGDIRLGSGRSSGGTTDWYTGLLDDVRLWEAIRSEDEINERMTARLVGTELNLFSYWPLDAGRGRGVADMTGRGSDMYSAGSPSWTGLGAPIDACATTDDEGNYAIEDIRYGEATTFRVEPVSDVRDFDPGFKTITLDSQSPVANEVQFTDITSYALTGTVSFEGSTCGQEGVQLYIDDQIAGATRADGSYSVVAQPGPHVVEARYEGHSFSPSSMTLEVFVDTPGLDFTNVTTNTLSGTVAGGCGLGIGTVDLRIVTQSGCYDVEVSATGDYSIDLPPQTYDVVFVDVNDVPPPLDTAEVFTFFQDLGSQEIDLTDGDVTFDLTYRAPISMEITGLPDTPAFDFTDSTGTVVGAAAPIIAQLDSAVVTVRLFEDYGFEECPVDSGTVTIWDEVMDTDDSPVTIEIVDGVGTYTTRANTPNVYAGRRDADGNPRSYQKSIVFSGAVEGRDPTVKTEWLLVTGSKPRTGTFVSATTEEVPVLILRDPPGDGSTSTRAEGTSYSYTIGGSQLIGVETEVELELKAGLAFEIGTMFFAQEQKVEATNDIGVSVAFSTVLGGEAEVTITTTEEWSTSDGETFVGADADVYLGLAWNLLFAKADVLGVDDAGVIDFTQEIRFGPDADEPFESVYLYTDAHIRDNVIPQLEEIAAANPGQSDLVESAIENWQNHRARNAELKEDALDGDVVNRSFSAGADYAYNHTEEESDTFEWEVTMAAEEAISQSFGFFFGGQGTVGKYTATLSLETTISGSETEGSVIETSYNLTDDDIGDYFSVDVGTDPHYGTPVFRTVSGRSSCPLEANTQPRDHIEFDIDPPLQAGVPVDEVGEYTLYITNASDSGEAREIQLRAIQTTNPGGAVMRVNGSILDQSLSFFVDPGDTHAAALTVERGPSQYHYEELKIQAVAPCEYAIWEDGGALAVADTVSFDLSFDAPCSDIAMLTPSIDWEYTQANEPDSIEILLDDFELAISETDSLQELGAEYRRIGTETWFNIDRVAGSDVPVFPDTHPLAGDPMSVEILWDVSGIPDGAYAIRPYTLCSGGKVTGSTAPGMIDRASPTVFDDPEPADLVLSLGDQISITFDEDIDCSTVAGAIAMEKVSDGSPIIVSATCSGPTVILTAENPTLSELEGEMVTTTIGTALTDARGNPLADPVAWTFTVVRSAFAWQEARVSADVPFRSGGTATATLTNGTIGEVTFDLTDVASWLSPDLTSGSVPAGEQLEVSFAIDPALPVGSYLDSVYAAAPDSTIASTVSLLEIQVDVGCVAPTWAFTPSDYEYQMTAVIDLQIDGATTTDENDVIAAFVGNELRGVASPVEVPELGGGTTLVFLNMYSNLVAGENVRFRVYDDSECYEYGSSDRFFRFEADRRYGTPQSPEVVTALDALPADIQSIAMAEGWTWFSLNLEDELDMTTIGVLGDLNPEPDDIVKSQTGFSTYDASIGWTGSLTDLDNARSFAIRLSEAGTLLHQGQPVDFDLPISIVDGWNWVGYPPSEAQPVDDALVNVIARDGDLVKSQHGFAEYVQSLDTWVGNLDVMEPGLGYKLYVFDADPMSGWLRYGDPLLARDVAPVARLTGPTSSTDRFAGDNRPEWTLDVGRQFNMTIVAEVTLDDVDVAADGGLLGAFVDDELRGVAELQEIPGAGAQVAFLMVHSNVTAGETVRFRYYDPTRDAVVDVAETIDFEVDEAMGSIREPFALRAFSGPSGPGSPLVTTLAGVVPNPVRGTNHVTFRWVVADAEQVSVHVYDVQGRLVHTVVDQQLPAGIYERRMDTSRLASGVYFYRMRAGQFTKDRKLMVIR